MSGSKVNFYGSTATSLTNIQTVLDGTRMGFNAISLTNYSTTSVPAIAAGSQVEIAGSLYKFSSEEPISTTNVTSTANATWYIELVPSSSIVSAQFSTTTPAWREDYYGYYTSTSSLNKVIGETLKQSSLYISKNIYSNYRVINSGINQTAFNFFDCIYISGTQSSFLNPIDFPPGYTPLNTLLVTGNLYISGFWNSLGPNFQVSLDVSSTKINVYSSMTSTGVYRIILTRISW